MDNRQVFRLAVQKARENGWTHFTGEEDCGFDEFLKLLDADIDVFFTKRDTWALVVFDFQFLKAFWGREFVVPIGRLWEYHWYRMAQSGDPLRYIAGYL